MNYQPPRRRIVRKAGINLENEINEDVIKEILISKEKRTSLMIGKIPEKFLVQQLLEEIDSQLNIINPEDRIYDYFYIPMSGKKKQKNLKYAFINLVHPLYVVHFYYKFRNYKWVKFNSNRDFSIRFADKQGKELLQEQMQRHGNDKKPNIFETSPKIVDFQNNNKIKISVPKDLKQFIIKNNLPNIHIFEFIDE